MFTSKQMQAVENQVNGTDALQSDRLRVFWTQEGLWDTFRVFLQTC